MKHLSIVLVLMMLLGTAGAAFAQDNGPIALNDSTPSIDIVVSPTPGTTGAISLQLSGASVIVKNSEGNIVFQTSDPRVNGLELRFAPNAGAHTVTVERLPGVLEAYVAPLSQSDLTPTIGTSLTTIPTLGVGQEFDTPLSADTPSTQLSLSVPTDSIASLQASFPGAPVTAQVIDSLGTAVATLQSGQIDGLNLTLNNGDYNLTLVNKDATVQTVAAISLMPAPAVALPAALMTPPAASNEVVAAPSTQTCNVQISMSSINLRSGPGTGYSVLGYAFRNDVLTVGGTNIPGNWLVVADDAGTSAWIDKSLGVLSGDCTNLATFDVPYKEAVGPQIIIQQAPANNTVGPNPSSPNGEHEGGEHEDGEHEGDG